MERNAPMHHAPHFTFRIASDRTIPRFRLEGVEVGQRLRVYKIDPGTGERLGLLATAVGNGGGHRACGRGVCCGAGSGKRGHRIDGVPWGEATGCGCEMGKSPWTWQPLARYIVFKGLNLTTKGR